MYYTYNHARSFIIQAYKLRSGRSDRGFLDTEEGTHTVSHCLQARKMEVTEQKGSRIKHQSQLKDLEVWWTVSCFGRLKELETVVQSQWQEREHSLPLTGALQTIPTPLPLLFHAG